MASASDYTVHAPQEHEGVAKLVPVSRNEGRFSNGSRNGAAGKRRAGRGRPGNPGPAEPDTADEAVPERPEDDPHAIDALA